MLRIYDVILELMIDLRPVLDEVKRKDSSLWDQMKRALQSVLLNTAEGSASVGGTRNLRYATALGSMRETSACLDCALVFGYVREIEPELRRKIDHVTGTLVNVTKPHRVRAR